MSNVPENQRMGGIPVNQRFGYEDPNNRFFSPPPNPYLMEDVESPLMLYLNLRSAYCYALYHNQWRQGTVANLQWPQGSLGLKILLQRSTAVFNYRNFVPQMPEMPPSEQSLPPQPDCDFYTWGRSPKMVNAATQTAEPYDFITINFSDQAFPLNFSPLINGNQLFVDPLWLPHAGNYQFYVPSTSNYIVDLHGRLLRPKDNGLFEVARSGHYHTNKIEDLFGGP